MKYSDAIVRCAIYIHFMVILSDNNFKTVLIDRYAFQRIWHSSKLFNYIVLIAHLLFHLLQNHEFLPYFFHVNFNRKNLFKIFRSGESFNEWYWYLNSSIPNNLIEIF